MASIPAIAGEVGTVVVEKLKAILDRGEPLPWSRPWRTLGFQGGPYNPTTGRAYAGAFNVFALYSVGGFYGDLRFAGAKQWEKAGNPIRKGEKGIKVLSPLFRCYACSELVSSGVDRCKNDHDLIVNGVRSVKLAGYSNFTVYNNQQGTKPLPALNALPDIDPAIGFDKAAKILVRSGARVVHGGDQASYNPRADLISLPAASAFESVSDYWATAMHELVHWTGHDSRLARSLDGRFGTPNYSFEELVAEVGSAILCGELGVTRPGMDEQHAAYLASWIKGVESKPTAFYTATTQAQAAVKYLLNPKK